MADETPPREIMTPTKPTTDLPVLTTPTGGCLYNPFHKDYVDRLGEATVTPGLFASFKKSVPKSEAVKPIPFIWSPEVQGDHFPTPIDENPIYQLQMQQQLDADIEEAAQSKITRYFRSNIIAPSPDITRGSFKGKPTLPRTSSLKPTFASDDVIEELPCQKTTVMADVGVQTTLSVSLEVDFPLLLRKAVGLEEKENLVCSVEDPSFNRNGIIYSETCSERSEDPHLYYRRFVCPQCLERKPLGLFRQRSLFTESSDGDTTIAAASSSHDTGSIHTTEITSSEYMESVADDLGVPVSWLSSSVSSSSLQQHKRSPKDMDKFNRSDCTNLTGLLEQAEIGCCRTPLRKPPRVFESVSPLVAGRTSPEMRGLQRPLSLSFTMDNEDEYGAGDEESTRDSCMPHKRQCKHESHMRGMASPDLSPIYCPTDHTHAPMDQGEDDYVDVDALPLSITKVKGTQEKDKNSP